MSFPLERADAIPRSLLEALLSRGDSPHTRSAYELDVRTFERWLEADGLSWSEVTADDLDRYRGWLAERYAGSTVNRRLSSLRSLYREALRRGFLETDPAADLRGLRGRDERDGGVLSASEAARLLDAIRDDLERPAVGLMARRDLALVGLLLRTGMRRSEAASLRAGSLGLVQGHHVFSVVAKGRVLRTVKVPPDVFVDVVAWLEAAAAAGYRPGPNEALFVGVHRGGLHCHQRPLSGRSIHDIVSRRLRQAGCPALGPHALRATFATLALLGHASLYQIQRALGHADPRTTERYLRKADSLDDHAADYVQLGMSRQADTIVEQPASWSAVGPILRG